MIESDDIYCYDHDMHRLYVLVRLMFHEEYHVLAPMTVELYDDAIGLYDAIMKNVFGEPKMNEMIAWSHIDDFVLSASTSLHQEHYRWEM